MQCGRTIALMLVPSHNHWKLSKDQAVVWDFQRRNIKIDKCKPRGWCPAEPDQITSQYTPGTQILHTIKHASDAQKDINLRAGFSTLESTVSPQREEPPCSVTGRLPAWSWSNGSCIQSLGQSGTRGSSAVAHCDSRCWGLLSVTASETAPFTEPFW